jgi:transposase
VVLRVRMQRWRCRNPVCGRQTFASRLPEVAEMATRRTNRVAHLMRLLGHATGGRPAERLMARLGMAMSDDTILRGPKRTVPATKGSVRVVGIDDWAWVKGRTYGTLIVDLERRQVVDVLADRSAASTAPWFSQHPEVEIVSRDRCGIYARVATQGAPQARRVADRFHLLQNLRAAVERQASRTQIPNV